MNPALTSFVAGAVGFTVFVLLGLVVLRLPGGLPVPRLALLALLIHALTTLLAAGLVPGVTYWHGAALYWLCFNTWLFCFSAVYKSVSLRILSKLAGNPDRSIPLSAIVESHVRPCFTERTEILVQGGLAGEARGTFALTERGQVLAGRFGRVQRFFGVQRSGLYTA